MRQYRRSGPLDAREGALMYLLRKYVRQAGAAPLPEPSQPSDPATLWAGDLRRSATLARAVLADGQNPSLPCPMAGDVGRGFEAQRSRKNPHERDHGDRAIGEFSGGKSGGMLRWRRCKKLHFHFLPLFPSFTLATLSFLHPRRLSRSMPSSSRRMPSRARIRSRWSNMVDLR